MANSILGILIKIIAEGSGAKQATLELQAVAQEAEKVAAAFRKLAGSPLAAFRAFEAAGQKAATLTDDLGGLTVAMEELASEQQYLNSTTELLDASYDVMSAGFGETVEAQEILRRSTEAAVGGFSDLGTVSNATTTILNAYGQGAEYAGNVTDQMIATQNAGKIVVAEYASLIGQVASTASAAGLRLEELNAFIATSTAAGVKAGPAINGLRQAIAALLKPSAEAEKILGELGYESGALALQQDGLIGVLRRAEEAGYGGAEGLTKLLGSTEAVAAVLPAVNMEAEEFNTTLTYIRDSAGLAAEAADTVAQSFDTKVRQALNQASEILVSVGRGVREVAAPVLDFVIQLLELVDRVPEPAKQAAGGVLAIAAALATLTAGAASAAVATGAAQAALVPLLAAAAPLLPVVAGVAAAVGALVVAWQSLDQQTRDNVLQTINGYAVLLRDNLTDLWEATEGWREVFVQVGADIITNVLRPLIATVAQLQFKLVEILTLGQSARLAQEAQAAAARAAVERIDGEIDALRQSLSEGGQVSREQIIAISNALTRLEQDQGGTGEAARALRLELLELGAAAKDAGTYFEQQAEDLQQSADAATATATALRSQLAEQTKATEERIALIQLERDEALAALAARGLSEQEAAAQRVQIEREALEQTVAARQELLEEAIRVEGEGAEQVLQLRVSLAADQKALAERAAAEEAAARQIVIDQIEAERLAAQTRTEAAVAALQQEVGLLGAQTTALQDRARAAEAEAAALQASLRLRVETANATIQDTQALIDGKNVLLEAAETDAQRKQLRADILALEAEQAAQVEQRQALERETLAAQSAAEQASLQSERELQAIQFQQLQLENQIAAAKSRQAELDLQARIRTAEAQGATEETLNNLRQQLAAQGQITQATEQQGSTLREQAGLAEQVFQAKQRELDTNQQIAQIALQRGQSEELIRQKLEAINTEGLTQQQLTARIAAELGISKTEAAALAVNMSAAKEETQATAKAAAETSVNLKEASKVITGIVLPSQLQAQTREVRQELEAMLGIDTGRTAELQKQQRINEALLERAERMEQLAAAVVRHNNSVWNANSNFYRGLVELGEQNFLAARELVAAHKEMARQVQIQLQVEQEILIPMRAQTAELEKQSSLRRAETSNLDARVQMLTEELRNAELRNASTEELLEIEEKLIQAKFDQKRVQIEIQELQLETVQLQLKAQIEEAKLRGEAESTIRALERQLELREQEEYFLSKTREALADQERLEVAAAKQRAAATEKAEQINEERQKLLSVEREINEELRRQTSAIEEQEEAVKRSAGAAVDRRSIEEARRIQEEAAAKKKEEQAETEEEIIELVEERRQKEEEVLEVLEKQDKVQTGTAAKISATLAASRPAGQFVVTTSKEAYELLRLQAEEQRKIVDQWRIQAEELSKVTRQLNIQNDLLSAQLEEYGVAGKLAALQVERLELQGASSEEILKARRHQVEVERQIEIAQARQAAIRTRLAIQEQEYLLSSIRLNQELGRVEYNPEYLAAEQATLESLNAQLQAETEIVRILESMPLPEVEEAQREVTAAVKETLEVQQEVEKALASQEELLKRQQDLDGLRSSILGQQSQRLDYQLKTLQAQGVTGHRIERIEREQAKIQAQQNVLAEEAELIELRRLKLVNERAQTEARANNDTPLLRLLQEEAQLLERSLRAQQQTVSAAKNYASVAGREILPVERQRTTEAERQADLEKARKDSAEAQLGVYSLQDRLLQMRIERFRQEGRHQADIDELERQREQVAARALALQERMNQLKLEQLLLEKQTALEKATGQQRDLLAQEVELLQQQLELQQMITREAVAQEKAAGTRYIIPGNIGALPELAEGGLVTRPTAALLGEAGPEIVAPLSWLNKLVQGVRTATVAERTNPPVQQPRDPVSVSVNPQLNTDSSGVIAKLQELIDLNSRRPPVQPSVRERLA